MSAGPLFIREPGAYVAYHTNGDPPEYLVGEGEEPVLIEEILITAGAAASDAGFAVLSLKNYGEEYPVLAVPIPAATDIVTHRIPANIVVPVGWSMRAQTRVELAGASGNAVLAYVGQGGVLR